MSKAEEESYGRIKKVLAIALMCYLDNVRPYGKMCLSNGECMQIDKAFNDKDWITIEKYIMKYSNDNKRTD